MQALNDFFTVSDPVYREGILTCRITFNSSHEIFKGHFPQQSVVPGVCTMHIVKALLEAASGKKLLLTEAPVVKFLQLMLPDSMPEVTIVWSYEEGMISSTANFKIANTAVFKMNATFSQVG